MLSEGTAVRASGDFLVRIESSGAAPLGAAPPGVAAAGTTFTFEPLFEFAVEATPGAGGLAAAPRRAIWHRARATGTAIGSAWDAAYEVARQARTALAGPGAEITHVEPDLLQEWPVEVAPSTGLGATDDNFHDQSEQGGKAVLPTPREFTWHLDDALSGLASARADAHRNQSLVVRIAHLDVGYGLHHKTFPKGFEPLLSRNVTGDGRPERDVEDRVKEGLHTNPGHGTGTVGILAGGQISLRHDGYVDFDGQLGAAPEARIVGVRVGNSVVQIRTSSVAQAIAYVADLSKSDDTRVHVLSMSMGGVASRAWADAVNLAYERGVVLVTAAGNNISTGLGGVPTTSTVYPARFERVLSACGIMANLKPYYGLKAGTMQGNWGPKDKQGTSLAAFTPNTSWARRADDEIVDMDGAGTSSATPQIAGAAALYLQKHGATLFDAKKYPEPWMRVEAVRAALVQSAKKGFSKDDLKKLGAGVLRANMALQIATIPAAQLEQSPKADASFAFLHTLFGVGLAAGTEHDTMLQLEMAQLVQHWEMGDPSDPATKHGNPFDAILADVPKRGLNLEKQRSLAEMLRSHPRASVRLKRTLSVLLGKPTPQNGGAVGAAGPGGTPAPVSRSRRPTRFHPVIPKFLSLRGYALDPSFAVSLSTHNVSETVYRIPWDEELGPGPRDEYLEVVDVDPASRTAYEPVDLDHPSLLATQGLAPSEGTPQFHQQMVYAVARMTIEKFESALGRKALWRPGLPPPGKNEKDDSVYVQRLRVYPHAFRAANAFYSPMKIALLFGYFNSRGTPGRGNGGRMQQVFTCLSQDIVAHETTHALLDGMHRKYLNGSNPDVLAFHEAFADIVALLQRLGLPELLRHQIAATRGEIRTRQSLLGELATQFGQATGERGGLREAIGTIDPVTGKWTAFEPTGTEYEDHMEAHDRGSILVAAVFDAFLSIYERRTEDLVRIATNGTGILQIGAIHPDLVARLADEATKAASHVLQMCIRALDYCPPTDITFGEYLRAIITADFDLVPDDDLGYRVAFIEAFRKRGIPVDEVRTISVESLLWRRESDEPQRLSRHFCERLWEFRTSAYKHAFTADRKTIFHLQRAVRSRIHKSIADHFQSGASGSDDARTLGLDCSHGFEVHAARFAARVGPDGQLLSQMIITLLQEEHRHRLPDGNFEGGCTVVADLSTQTVRYIIRKSFTSQSRFERQRQFALAADRSGDRLTYFRAGGQKDEPFAALHAKGGF
jgi:Subtilase family